MLIAFHCFSIFIFQLWRNRKRLKTDERSEIRGESEGDYELKFDPPVYRQRYAAVYETLLDDRWRSQIKKLVDFGCAEFGLFVFVKRLSLNDIFFVDIQEDLLKENLGRLRPLIIDNIKRRNDRFDVTVFAGSVSDPDYRLHKTDCVTAIELIEHLYPDVLDAFSYNVFGNIQPRLVIVTTPNADFNVMFRSLQKFRHADHKFEWTRRQFEDWANNLAERYADYTVRISGIGPGPPHSAALGCCSQMAVFVHKKLLNDNYVSPTYARACSCRHDSPCKGVTVYAKLRCRCLCPLCQPSSSLGICTHGSYSEQIISYEMSDCKDFNPAYNIYYKLVEKIQYPFEIDGRSEEEKMLSTFRYRINNLYGRPNSRFYKEDRETCEIPLKELLYGCEDVNVSESELSKALLKFGYTVEDRPTGNSQTCESCVIFAPEMDDYSSTSESASGYDSERGKFQQSEEPLSDWDDAASSRVVAELQSTANKDSKPEALSAAPTEDEKIQQDSLFDSGYQKSLSLLDDSPETPLDVEETDVFDDASEDSNKAWKKITNNKKPVDPNKINELDSIPQVLLKLPQPEVFRKTFKDNVPGPSNVKKKKKIKKADSDDGPLADAKSVADTIIENTLNKIDVEDEQEIMRIAEKQRKRRDEDDDKRREEEGEEERRPQVEAGEEERRGEEEEVALVENGDLANNNRDLEGNNYVAEEIDGGVDFLNDNLEMDGAAIAVHNVIFENNNEEEREDVIVEEEEFIMEEQAAMNGAEPRNDGDNTEPPEEISLASREALFDPNSEEDLLEDFEMPPPLPDAEMLQNYASDAAFYGIVAGSDAAVETNGFPNWLLQILGTPVSLDGGASVAALEAAPAAHDEPHFYCQGDGLGVHPSVVAVEIEQDEADDETTTTTTSTSHNADFAEAEREPSYQEVGSLPAESRSEVAAQADEGGGGRDESRGAASDG